MSAVSSWLHSDLGRGACPVCATPACTCVGTSEPFVGRPIGHNGTKENPLGMTLVTSPVIRAAGRRRDVVVARERIYSDRDPVTGGRRLLYPIGAEIPVDTAKALGLEIPAEETPAAPAKGGRKAQKSPQEAGVEDKAERPDTAENKSARQRRSDAPKRG